MAHDFNRENEEDSDLIELIDDETGESVYYEHLATVEYEGESYLILADPEAPEEEDLEVFILKIEQDDEGNDVYTPPEEDVADAVLEVFQQMLDDMEDDQ